MKSKVGVWIDHRKAVIVTITDQGEGISTIISHMEKHVRFSGEAAEGGAGEDVRDRGFGNHLAAYYDKVIPYLREAESVLIFGPGEAKGELEARLRKEGHKGPTVSVETTDKMTDPQIAEKVRQHFLK